MTRRKVWPYPLEHPTTSQPTRPKDCDPVLSGPLLVRTRTSTRWHRPRSGRIYHPESAAGARISWSFWCGPGSSHCITIDTLPTDGAPVCGPCEGRAIGAGYQGAAATLLYPMLFTPAPRRVPKLCPGARTMLCEELPGGRAGRCLVCGDVHSLRAGGSHYGYGSGGSYGLTNHPAGAGLVLPCPWHVWEHLVARDGRLECRCGPLPKPKRKARR